MHYYITISLWSHLTGTERDSFSTFSEYVGQLEGYEVDLRVLYEDENDKTYQSDLLTHNFECKRERGK